jgi:predicted Fe-S protein YdhL (DUF1289 family)
MSVMVVKTVKNPCKGICKFTENMCEGCMRTPDEKEGWNKMDNLEKQRTLRQCELRKRVYCA